MVDTRDKRMSMIGLGSPAPSILPNPDASFANANDRAMLEFLYWATLTAAVSNVTQSMLKGMFKGMFKGMNG